MREEKDRQTHGEREKRGVEERDNTCQDRERDRERSDNRDTEKTDTQIG